MTPRRENEVKSLRLIRTQVENATRLNTQKQLSTCRTSRRCRMAPSRRARAAASARAVCRLSLKGERAKRVKESAGKSQSISQHESSIPLQDAAGFFWRRYGNRGLRRRSRALSIVSSATRRTHMRYLILATCVVFGPASCEKMETVPFGILPRLSLKRW